MTTTQDKPATSADAPAAAGQRDARATGWSDDLDRRAVDLIRVLAMDAVEAAGSGHPGTAMSLAPAAYLLFQEMVRHDPSDPEWVGRDRFVLSCGHSSLTLYIQLFLSGYGLTVEDLKLLRQWGSRTPGHPEHGHTLGVEVTTGPLGQGVGNAVGMAMAARRERGLFDPDAPEGESIFDHTIWAICSDGDLEEGVSAEASSLGGHQRLGNIVMIYDDNHISIEDNTDVAFSEDVLARYAAYGWHTQRVNWLAEDGSYTENIGALRDALQAGKAETSRPSIIALRSIIGWPAPTKQNTGKAHGSALGAEEVAKTKEILGFDPSKSFDVPMDVLEHTRKVGDRGRQAKQDWEKRFRDWQQAEPERSALQARMAHRRLPDGWQSVLPVFPPDEKGTATREASGEVLSALKDVLPELWGGSADLAGSTNTTMKGADSFLPVESGAKDANPYGRTLHFGIREHGMGAVMNGMATHGGTRPYGATFLVFSDYMRGAVRLAAIMKLPVTYVWTHDSIGLGEDGPTHQPVEQLASLRAVPGLDVVRPADANETVVAWRTILENTDRPAGLVLSRQKLPTVDRTTHGGTDGVAKGAYVLAESGGGMARVIIIATGSEVPIALAARELLEAEGTPTRVVSMPCREWFEAQEDSYRQSVLPPSVKARVSVEAAVAMGWRDLVGEAGETVSLEHFGASAPYTTLYEQFGFTPERVVAAAHASLAKVGATSGSTTGN